MPRIVELGPLTISRDEGDRCRFTLSAPEQMTLSVPRDYQQHLSQKLGDLLAEDPEVSVTLDLEDLPGISSRQLGVMLALRRVSGHIHRSTRTVRRKSVAQPPPAV